MHDAEDLARSGERRARGSRCGTTMPATSVAAELDLTGVQSRTNRDAVFGDGVTKRRGATRAARRTVEGGEHAVALLV